MPKYKGYKDTYEVKQTKSEAAKQRWSEYRKQKVEEQKTTIEGCINFLYDKAKECGMDLKDFVDGYSTVMFERKRGH